MTKPTKSKEELRTLIVGEASRHPVCPPGMDVVIESTDGGGWKWASIPPRGSSIAYADCVQHIGQIAQRLREQYDLAPDVPPVDSWSTQQPDLPPRRQSTALQDDGSSWVPRPPQPIAALEPRVSNAVLSPVGSTETPLPAREVANSVARMRELTSESEPDAALEREIFEYAIREQGRDDAPDTARVRSTPAEVRHKLAADPTGIRNAALALATAVEEQIDELNASRPNDDEALARHKSFVGFLEMVASELHKLADALDRAIEHTSPDQQRMFLGRAAEIVERLKIDFDEWFQQNHAHVAGFAMKIGLFGAAYVFLRALGVDGDIASVASAVLNSSLPASVKK